MRSVRVLAVSDEVDRRLYSNAVWGDRARPELILGCGDMPAYYLDYLVSRFNVPLYAIHGNHDAPPPLEGSPGYDGCGATWIGGRTANFGGLLLAGFDGSLRYNSGAYQSTQFEMQAAVRQLVPQLLLNRVRYGRYLDVLITHAPPRGIHDEPDICHTGFQAFNWLIQRFRPRYHLHGHIHLYDRRKPTVTRVGATEVINVYPFRELTLAIPDPAPLRTCRVPLASRDRVLQQRAIP
ncbi:MAG: metallophosphoesterase [Chloroflexota bacterium]|nr:metallophosphoesterase [Chloroflexota bacterium]